MEKFLVGKFFVGKFFVGKFFVGKFLENFLLKSSEPECPTYTTRAYLNVAYRIIYEDKLNCKMQIKSKDKEK